eukprot:scaffold21715_cov114-Skeletonema_marinoi.AAC.5
MKKCSSERYTNLAREVACPRGMGQRAKHASAKDARDLSSNQACALTWDRSSTSNATVMHRHS